MKVVACREDVHLVRLMLRDMERALYPAGYGNTPYQLEVLKTVRREAAQLLREGPSDRIDEYIDLLFLVTGKMQEFGMFDNKALMH